MKARHLLSTVAIAISAAHLPDQATADEEALTFTTPKGWGGETIALPPEFAPDMKVKGTEVIRFAPGMFDPKSETFFSYIFVFAVEGEGAFTDEVIHDEILVYYRGLATSVLKGKGKETDTSKFTFEMAKSDKAAAPPAGAGGHAVAEYRGTLDWVEPFATAKPQKLHLEIHAWSDPEAKRSYLVVGTSPNPIGEEEAIWVELRKIRAGFTMGAKVPK